MAGDGVHFIEVDSMDTGISLSQCQFSISSGSRIGIYRWGRRDFTGNITGSQIYF